MISLDQWQRMTPKQQWDTFNALQNEQARAQKLAPVEVEAPRPPSRARVTEVEPQTDTSL